MKKLLALSLALTITLTGISACSSKKISDLKDDKGQNLNDLPEWVVAPEVDYGVAAVGIASPSAGGIKFQIPRAELDAKANIAAAVQSEISRVTKEALRQAQVNNVDDVEQVFSQATKEVVKNMPLSGVKRINMYQAKDGTLYIRMVLKNDDYSKYMENSEKMYESRLKKANLGRENLNKSQNAVKGLFDELEKERGNTPSKSSDSDNSDNNENE